MTTTRKDPAMPTTTKADARLVANLRTAMTRFNAAKAELASADADVQIALRALDESVGMNPAPVAEGAA